MKYHLSLFVLFIYLFILHVYHWHAGLPKQHNAFPLVPVYLAGFDDKVTVLSSMIRPKKITCIGSDGNKYPFLCKPKDDLRKDARLMEFNGIVNKLLRKETQSRRMQLHIKTYVSEPSYCFIIYYLLDSCLFPRPKISQSKKSWEFLKTSSGVLEKFFRIFQGGIKNYPLL